MDNNKLKRRIVRILAVVLIATLSSCATLSQKPLKPKISLVEVQPLNVSLSQQQLRFILKIENPNAFELPLKGVNFIAKFNQADIASGRSQHAVRIPANGSGTLPLDVTAGVDTLLDSLKQLLKKPKLEIDYQLNGSIRVSNWNSPIPFDLAGTVDVSKQFPLLSN